MSYQVIARKWRPQAFDEVTGQEHVTQTLRNALAHDRLHHAYLFSGARGVGKTTTARLLAKALNCHKTQTPNLTPCKFDDPDACASCIEIAESRSLDVLEFDAASNTQVDKIREIILQNINIAPARDRYKVFIIDEVHMLSASSFNALLKTVEEPTDNVVFVMATTELHKVPETIRSRCQEFEFRTIPLEKILDRLKLIADAEKISIDDSALRQIARSGMGSMRDAQSNFDQVISFSGESISPADVSNALGIASTKMLTMVLDAILEKSGKTILEAVAELVSRGQDMRHFCRDMLAVIRDLMVFKVSEGDTDLIETSALTIDEVKRYSEGFSESDLLRFFNSLCDTEILLKEAVQPRYVLETGLVKLVEMRRVVPIEQILERLGHLAGSLSGTESEKSAAAAVQATGPEKKTLNSEPIAVDSLDSEPPDVESPGDEIAEPPPSVREDFPQPEITSNQLPVIDLGFLDSMPVKLAPIESEALEHIEDAWLDAAYERKLERTGDDLTPIATATSLAESILGSAAATTAVKSHANGSGGTGAAPALSPLFVPPDFSEQDEHGPAPDLPENATQEQLTAFAANHPLVRKTMRVFRATIVDVKKL